MDNPLTSVAELVDKSPTYFKTFGYVFDPSTLTDYIDASMLGAFPSHYCKHQDGAKTRIEHFENGSKRTEYLYHQSPDFTDMVVKTFDGDGTFSLCYIHRRDHMRHLRSFSKTGNLVSEEWYNENTTEYQLATFDEAGNIIHQEYGSSRPIDD